MDINKEVVGNIAKLRKQNHLTQEQMAEKIGMSKNGYAKLERGQSKVNLEHLAQIADIFGMEISELLKENREFTVFIVK